MGTLLRGAHAVAVSEDDGTALEDVATAFEDIGALLFAAEAAAEASSAFSRSRRKSQAERAAARSGLLLAACEGARTPLLEELERPLPLTRREREVVNLAADGLSSQAIADRLFLSARTVEGHLHKAYGKLGVTEHGGLARGSGCSSARRRSLSASVATPFHDDWSRD